MKLARKGPWPGSGPIVEFVVKNCRLFSKGFPAHEIGQKGSLAMPCREVVAGDDGSSSSSSDSESGAQSSDSSSDSDA